jgi:hypothetical protein
MYDSEEVKTEDCGLVQEAMLAGARLTEYVDTQIAVGTMIGTLRLVIHFHFAT